MSAAVYGLTAPHVCVYLGVCACIRCVCVCVCVRVCVCVMTLQVLGDAAGGVDLVDPQSSRFAVHHRQYLFDL